MEYTVRDYSTDLGQNLMFFPQIIHFPKLIKN